MLGFFLRHKLLDEMALLPESAHRDRNHRSLYIKNTNSNTNIYSWQGKLIFLFSLLSKESTTFLSTGELQRNIEYPGPKLPGPRKWYSQNPEWRRLWVRGTVGFTIGRACSVGSVCSAVQWVCRDTEWETASGEKGTFEGCCVVLTSRWCVDKSYPDGKEILEALGSPCCMPIFFPSQVDTCHCQREIFQSSKNDFSKSMSWCLTPTPPTLQIFLCMIVLGKRQFYFSENSTWVYKQPGTFTI